MRIVTICSLVLAPASSAPAMVGTRGTRTVTCCVRVTIPGVGTQPTMAVVNITKPRRFHIGDRALCRLAAGRLPMHGACA